MNAILTAEMQTKFLNALNDWAISFKIIGNGGSETPRYSQIMRNKEGVFCLHSTQKSLFFLVNLTEEETEILRRSSAYEFNDLWNEWKALRTDFLLKNHPTISAY